MLSLQALNVFWLQSFLDAQWFDICWLEMSTKSTGLLGLHFPHIRTRYPKEWPNAHKHSQTMLAVVGLPTELLLVIYHKFFCTATVGICWCSYSACIDLLMDQRLFMNLCTSKKIYEANESCQKLKFQQWWLWDFFNKVMNTVAPQYPRSALSIIMERSSTLGSNKNHCTCLCHSKDGEIPWCSVFSAPSLGNPCWSPPFWTHPSKHSTTKSAADHSSVPANCRFNFLSWVVSQPFDKGLV